MQGLVNMVEDVEKICVCVCVCVRIVKIKCLKHAAHRLYENHNYLSVSHSWTIFNIDIFLKLRILIKKLISFIHISDSLKSSHTPSHLLPHVHSVW